MNITLAAGGTGGHMVPAHALAAELKARGHGVMLVTDERGAKIPALFEGVPTHILPAGRLGGGPIGWIKACLAVLAGRREAKALYREFTPDAVVGFGGYPAFPALLAANALSIPTILHEQNAVLGRVNRLLAGRAAAIATAYPEVERLKPAHRRKVELVGNPVRESVARLGTMPFPEFDDTAPLKILVTGGSQGATVLGQVVPDALGMLPPKLRHRLQVIQQCRPDDIEAVRNRYAALNIPAELLTYIEDMPDRLGRGASRDRPGRRVDHRRADRGGTTGDPHSAADRNRRSPDRQRARNGQGGRRADDPAKRIYARGAGAQIEAIAGDAQALSNAAERALSVGRPHATHDLADLVERIAGGAAPLMVGKAEPVARPEPSGMGVPA